MKFFLAFLVSVCLLTSCSVLNPTAKDQLGSTTASYKTADGTAIDYTSNKNQENFKAAFMVDPATGKISGLSVETTAVTPESAIAATAQAQAATAALLNKLLDMIPAAAKAGALAGS